MDDKEKELLTGAMTAADPNADYGKFSFKEMMNTVNNLKEKLAADSALPFGTLAAINRADDVIEDSYQYRGRSDIQFIKIKPERTKEEKDAARRAALKRGFPLSARNKEILQIVKSRLSLEKSAFGAATLSRLDENAASGQENRPYSSVIGLSTSMILSSHRVFISAAHNFGEITAMRLKIFQEFEGKERADIISEIAKKTGYGEKRVEKLIKRARNREMFAPEAQGAGLNFFLTDNILKSPDWLARIAEQVYFTALTKQAQTQIVMVNSEFLRQKLHESLFQPEPYPVEMENQDLFSLRIFDSFLGLLGK